MNSTCQTTPGPSGNNQYLPRHNPVVFYAGVCNSANTVDWTGGGSGFPSLPSTGNPALTWITPAACDDMHSNCPSGVNPGTAGDTFLSQVIPKIEATQDWQNGGVIFVIWDESDSGSLDQTMPGLVISPLVKSGYISYTPYDHYSTLRTIEDLLGLPYMRQESSPSVRDMMDIWNTVPSGLKFTPLTLTSVTQFFTPSSYTYSNPFASTNSYVSTATGFNSSDVWGYRNYTWFQSSNFPGPSQSLAIDGSAHACSGSTTTCSVLVTTSSSPDVLIAFAEDSGSTNTITVGGGGLSWTNRSTVKISGKVQGQEWYSIASSPLSSANVSVTASAGTVALIVIPIMNANATNPFDPNPGFVYHAVNSSVSQLPTLTGISTSNANDMIVAGLVWLTNSAQSGGTGWTYLLSGGNRATGEYKVVNTIQSGLVANFSTAYNQKTVHPATYKSLGFGMQNGNATLQSFGPGYSMFTTNDQAGKTGYLYYYWNNPNLAPPFVNVTVGTTTTQILYSSFYTNYGSFLAASAPAVFINRGNSYIVVSDQSTTILVADPILNGQGEVNVTLYLFHANKGPKLAQPDYIMVGYFNHGALQTIQAEDGGNTFLVDPSTIISISGVSGNPTNTMRFCLYGCTPVTVNSGTNIALFLNYSYWTQYLVPISYSITSGTPLGGENPSISYYSGSVLHSKATIYVTPTSFWIDNGSTVTPLNPWLTNLQTFIPTPTSSIVLNANPLSFAYATTAGSGITPKCTGNAFVNLFSSACFVPAFVNLYSNVATPYGFYGILLAVIDIPVYVKSRSLLLTVEVAAVLAAAIISATNSLSVQIQYIIWIAVAFVTAAVFVRLYRGLRA
jgi:hypothetical protein